MIPEKQIITSDPEVIIHEISEEDEFFVIACDGQYLSFVFYACY
jgi:protein phosphatase 2C family protein 2/3